MNWWPATARNARPWPTGLSTTFPGLKVFALPEAHRLRLRTSNSQENLNRQIRRRTRVATILPNLGSLLRLLVEISEEWENSKAYLNMNQTKATDSAA